MADNQEFAGKVAFVTGGGSGIGRAAAIAFAKNGAKVGVLDDNREAAAAVVEEIKNSGAEALLLFADAANAEAVRGAVADTIAAFGRIDCVFANAGINGVLAPLDELEPEEWRKTIDNNLTSTFLTVKYTIPALKRAGQGAIVITASINGTRYFANSGATAYACSKAGQVAFAQMAALELAKHKIRVNVICPGAIATNIEDSQEKRDVEREREPVETPQGNIPLTRGEKGTAEQVADLVLFLSGDKSSHITGTPVFIDGAQSLLV